MYPEPHRHGKWADHRLRVETTLQSARWAADHLCADPVSVAGADLSCGDGYVLRGVSAQPAFFGDLAPGYEFTGPIEETIHQIPQVDLFVNTETLEHVDDPDKVLSFIRAKTDVLILSTPIGAWNDDNAEHLWAWDRQGVEMMLLFAGFRVHVFTALDFRPSGLPYCFGIWVAQ